MSQKQVKHQNAGKHLRVLSESDFREEKKDNGYNEEKVRNQFSNSSVTRRQNKS